MAGYSTTDRTLAQDTFVEALHHFYSVQVEKMAKQFNVAEDVSYTCETAAHFWLLHVLARWEKFLAMVAQRKTPECVKVWLCFGQTSASFALGMACPFCAGTTTTMLEVERYDCLCCAAGPLSL